MNDKAPRGAVRAFLHWLDTSFVRWFTILTYAYFFLIIFSEVVGRYVFSSSTTWGEMTARYAFVYFAYFAAAEAFRQDAHIRIDLVPLALSGRWRRVLESYIDILCVAVAVTVIYYSYQVLIVQVNAGFKMHALPINLAFAQAALPLGWGLMIIRIVERFKRRYATPLSSDGVISS